MEKKIPLIVEKNKDVEHIMLAGARYGVHGGGVPNMGKLFTMLCVADVHQSYAQMENAIDYLNYYDDVEVSQNAAGAHPKGAMQIRNREMVDRSDLVIFCVERNSGGAYQTMKYAIKNQKNIINLCSGEKEPDGLYR